MHFIALGALAICSVVLGQAPDGKVAKYSDQAKAEYESRQKAILAEIAALPDHPWAGTYFLGDGRGNHTTLSIAPEHGAVIYQRTQLGPFDRNYGPVTLSDRGTLRTEFIHRNEALADDYIPVTWGAREYLIPVGDYVAFGNAAMKGREPRKRADGDFFLREGDHEKTPGEPIFTIPPAFQSHRLTDPIQARITAVADAAAAGDQSSAGVSIDVGYAAGVFPGMAFGVFNPDKVEVGTVRIVSASDEKSKAMVVDWKSPAPLSSAIGWSVGTAPR